MKWKVYTSPFKTKDGKWSNKRVLLASFFLESDFNRYLDQCRAEHPTWLIETKRYY